MQSFSRIFGGLPGVESSRHTREEEDELDELDNYFRSPTEESYRQIQYGEHELD